MNLFFRRTFLLICFYCACSVAESKAVELEAGEVVGRHIFGLARDHQQSPVMVGEDPLIHSGSVSHHEFDLDDKSALVSLFDHTIGSVYLSEGGAEGSEGFVDTFALELETVSGLTQPSAAIKSPWGSLLFSENTGLNTAAPESFIDDMAPFFKGKQDLVKPYHYGWLGEVVLLEGGEAKVIKDYGVGRVAASQIIIMPDAKTVYLLDANHSGNLYVFIAEEANSLTQGTLYGVAITDNGVRYQKLGEGAALKTKFRLRRASFDAFFDSEQPEAGRCSDDFNFINTAFGPECLKLKKRARNYAGLFEPVRVLAMQTGSEAHSPVQSMEYDAENQALSLVFSERESLTFSLKPDSEMQSQYLMEVSL